MELKKDSSRKLGNRGSAGILSTLRSAVSRNKRRFRENGFDLDLAYITPRIIAMGFPSEKVEGLYRNPITEVIKMLKKYHGEHYRIYNLCSERTYDHSKFENRVAEFRFDDHNPPPFAMFAAFCEDAKIWLDENSLNVAVIHCKAGKGRTGVMACALLMLNEMRGLPTEKVLGYYASKRTYNNEGVTIPSQRRYIHYWNTVQELGGCTAYANPVPVYALHSLIFSSAPVKSATQPPYFITILSGSYHDKIPLVLLQDDAENGGRTQQKSNNNKNLPILPAQPGIKNSSGSSISSLHRNKSGSSLQQNKSSSSLHRNKSGSSSSLRRGYTLAAKPQEAAVVVFPRKILNMYGIKAQSKHDHAVQLPSPSSIAEGGDRDCGNRKPSHESRESSPRESSPREGSREEHQQQQQQQLVFDLPPLQICGDVCIKVYFRDAFRAHLLFQFWFNTFFEPTTRTAASAASPRINSAALPLSPSPFSPTQRSTKNSTETLSSGASGGVLPPSPSPSPPFFGITMEKRDIDKINKDKHNRIFPKDFRVFVRLEAPAGYAADPCLTDHYNSTQALATRDTVKRMQREGGSAPLSPMIKMMTAKDINNDDYDATASRDSKRQQPERGRQKSTRADAESPQSHASPSTSGESVCCSEMTAASGSTAAASSIKSQGSINQQRQSPSSGASGRLHASHSVCHGNNKVEVTRAKSNGSGDEGDGDGDGDGGADAGDSPDLDRYSSLGSSIAGGGESVDSLESDLSTNSCEGSSLAAAAAGAPPPAAESPPASDDQGVGGKFLKGLRDRCTRSKTVVRREKSSG